MTTVLSNVIVSEDSIRASIRGALTRLNQRASNQAGYMQVNIVRSTTLRRYDVSFKPANQTEWAQRTALFEVSEAGAYGVLLIDPTDNRVTGTEGVLQPYTTENVGTAGAGYGVPVYHLSKLYTERVSGRTKVRRITRAKTGYAITRGGAPVSVGASPGNIAVDADTGAVTFVADSFQALSSVTTGATTVLNFANGTGIVADMAVGERVYLSGLSGTAASTLNGVSHAITVKGAASLTVSTVTTGLAATGGTAYNYPQASEALLWTGFFYVPVQFESDELGWQLLRPGENDDRLIDGVGIVLVEVRE